MKKHSLMLALLCGAVAGTAFLTMPAQASPDCGGATTENSCVAVLYSPRAQTLIEITDGGVTQRIFCHNDGLELHETGDRHFEVVDGHPILRREAFTVCAGSTFSVGNNGHEMVNLTPSAVGGPFNLGKPFVQKGSSVTFLSSGGNIIDCGDGNAPLYNLDDPNGDGNTADALPLGTLVTVVTDNKPTNGQCIGVRTSFMFRVGTCKVWKIRKFYNTCKGNVTLTHVKEFEQLRNESTAGAVPGSNGLRTAVALDDEGHYITLAVEGNIGAVPAGANAKKFQPSGAGSIDDDTPFEREFCACKITDLTPDQTDRDKEAWLEQFLSFFPGGVVLKGVTKAGSEKFITFHIDVE